MPTVLEKAQSALGEIIGDIQAAKIAPLIDNATRVLEGINRLVNLPDTQRAFASLDETIASMNEAMAALKVASLSLDKRAVEIGGSVAQFTLRHAHRAHADAVDAEDGGRLRRARLAALGTPERHARGDQQRRTLGAHPGRLPRAQPFGPRPRPGWWTMRRALLTLALSLAGCTILAPRPDPSRFFTLSAVADGADAPSDGTVAVGLGPVRVPGYLDRPELATRVASSELVFSPTDRWAEPLSASLRRVIAQNLSAILGTEEIAAFPWPVGTHVDWAVAVDVLRFERTPDQEVEVTARWVVREGAGAACGSHARPATRSAPTAAARSRSSTHGTRRSPP